MVHVLIVDDDPSFVWTWGTMLRRNDYDVSAADSVRAAEAALRLRPPKAMLLDWKLPDGTGLDVLRWMYSEHLRIPTALVTGFWNDVSFHEMLAQAKDLGVLACIRRGIDFEEPGEIVCRLLDPLTDLHAAVLRRDSVACETVARIMLQMLVPRLRARFRALSLDIISDAVTDGALQYLRNPERFNAARYISVDRFITAMARRRVWNAIRSQKRDLARDSEYAHLRVMMMDAPETAVLSNGRRALAEALAREADTHVRDALQRWLKGEKDQSPWLSVPSLASLTPNDLAREIKRRKDAFIVRVKRVAKRRSARDCNS